MKEISLHILDIAQNSVRAAAKNISIELNENEEALTFSVKDDGCGMEKAFLKSVINPFTTTRTTRKVGLGIPLLKLSAEMTGGSVSIISKTGEEHGTLLKAVFFKKHIDYIPLGNMTDTLCTLIQGAPNIRWIYRHQNGNMTISLDTKQMKETLGENISLSCPEVLLWIRESLEEEYKKLYK